MVGKQVKNVVSEDEKALVFKKLQDYSCFSVFSDDQNNLIFPVEMVERFTDRELLIAQQIFNERKQRKNRGKKR